MPGTLLYCNPGLLPMTPKTWLGGEIAADKKIVNVKYNNWDFSNEEANRGIIQLDLLLHQYLGTSGVPTRVLGHSQGSQYIYKWIREKGPTSDLDPATIEFYTTGCPEMRYTGAGFLYPVETKANYPGTNTPHNGSCSTPSQFHGGWGVGSGLPAVVPWKLWCISGQYDGWSDAPNNLSNAEVVRVVKKASIFGAAQKVWDHSLTCLLKSMKGPHGGYVDIPLSDPARNFTYTDPSNPTVKYVWQLTYPVPSLNDVKWLRFVARNLDMERRPILEQAYTHRPISIPAPNYAATSSWFPLGS